MTKNEMDEKIKAVRDIMAELEYEVMKWLANLRDVINSFSKENSYED